MSPLQNFLIGYRQVSDARIIVLTEDLEIAETQRNLAQWQANDWYDRYVKMVDIGTVVLEQKEAAEAKLVERDNELLSVKKVRNSLRRNCDAAEAKLKEIAKLVDSDYENDTHYERGMFFVAVAIRRILK